ncbi:MAG: hypothetical protein GY822_14330 [Deltaproteobacteria bacterium]|nr:hypothetical protein [Deltaproteobacteria bacterium]
MNTPHASLNENAPQRRALLIWLCTLLLAIGWLVSSYAQEDLQENLWRQTRVQTLDVVKNAVDERLEALLAREDERPFTHYDHYYVPEGVLSSTAPLAISPLAAVPSDPRIIGYFQIDTSKKRYGLLMIWTTTVRQMQKLIFLLVCGHCFVQKS